MQNLICWPMFGKTVISVLAGYIHLACDKLTTISGLVTLIPISIVINHIIATERRTPIGITMVVPVTHLIRRIPANVREILFIAMMAVGVLL
jgi:hypothetical protein